MVSMVDLDTHWSFGDLTMANQVLDALEDAEERARKNVDG